MKNLIKKNPKKAIFLAIFIFVMFVIFIAEKILETRMSGIIYTGTPRAIWLREHSPNYKNMIAPGEEYIKNTDNLVNKKYKFSVDENGFIIPSKKYDNPDVTLVFLGGSTAECAFLEENNRLPYLAGELIENKTGKKVNSYNSGMSGNNSLDSINILVNKVVPLKPDIVLMAHNGSDLNILLYEGSYWNNNPHKAPVFTYIKNRGFICALLKDIKDTAIPYLYSAIKIWLMPKEDEFAHIRGKKITIEKDVILKQFEENLQLFINICNAKNITPVLLTEANRLKDNPDRVIQRQTSPLTKDFGIGYNEYRMIYNLFNDAISNVANKNNVLLIDLARKIPQEKECLYDSVHLTDKGSRLAADIISEELIKRFDLKNYKSKSR